MTVDLDAVIHFIDEVERGAAPPEVLDVAKRLAQAVGIRDTESARRVEIATALRKQADERTGLARAALIKVREMLHPEHEAVPLINRVLTPNSEPRLEISAIRAQEIDGSVTRIAYHVRGSKCEHVTSERTLCPAFIARMIASPCPECDPPQGG